MDEPREGTIRQGEVLTLVLTAGPGGAEVDASAAVGGFVAATGSG